MKICPVCGKPITKKWAQKYCSDKCKNKINYVKNNNKYTIAQRNLYGILTYRINTIIKKMQKLDIETKKQLEKRVDGHIYNKVLRLQRRRAGFADKAKSLVEIRRHVKPQRNGEEKRLEKIFIPIEIGDYPEVKNE